LIEIVVQVLIPVTVIAFDVCPLLRTPSVIALNENASGLVSAALLMTVNDHSTHHALIVIVDTVPKAVGHGNLTLKDCPSDKVHVLSVKPPQFMENEPEPDCLNTVIPVLYPVRKMISERINHHVRSTSDCVVNEKALGVESTVSPVVVIVKAPVTHPMVIIEEVRVE
jgi:hypothetical protein